MCSEIRTSATQAQLVAPHLPFAGKGRRFLPQFIRGLLILISLLLLFPRPGWPQSNDLQKLFADYYEFRLRDDPTTATFVGRADYNDRWDDPSPEHQEQYLASLQQFLRRLDGIPKTGLAASRPSELRPPGSRTENKDRGSPHNFNFRQRQPNGGRAPQYLHHDVLCARKYGEGL